MTENLWIMCALAGSLLLLAGVLTAGHIIDRRTRERQDE